MSSAPGRNHRERDQLVRALQVVVLERRLVDLAREERLVRGIGLDGIEVLGHLGEDGIEDIRAPVLEGKSSLVLELKYPIRSVLARFFPPLPTAC